MWWYMTVPSPNSEFWLVSYSQSVISSIMGPKEKIFRHAEVVPSLASRVAWCVRKTAAIWRFLSNFLPVLTFLLLGSIVSRLIQEAMTNTNWSSHSSLRVGGAHSMALSLVLVEDSSTSCLLAGGSSTQLKMVVGDGWWPPSGSSISRPFITSSRVIFTNLQMACLNCLMLSARGWKLGFLGTTMNQTTPQWRRSLLPKQTYPHHWKWRCQPCHCTHLLRPVFQRQRPP